MAYEDYQLIRISVADGVCRATIDNPPINLLNLELILEVGRLGADLELARAVGGCDRDLSG